MASVVFCLEGVLSNTTSAPIEQGMKLFKAIRTGYQPCVISSFMNVDEAHHWLKVQGIGLEEYDLLLTPLPWETTPVEHVKRVSSLGHNIGLFVTADLDAAREVMKMGVCTLGFIHPVYLRPEYRPDWDGGVRPWQEIEEETTRQKIMLAEDERVKQ